MKKIHNFYFPDWDNHFYDQFNINIGYQEAHRNRALSFVEDFRVAVDCGAHVGLWSRDLLNFFENLYCFEPVEEFFDCLKRNVDSKNVEFYNMALGEKYEDGTIIVTKNSGNSGLSHICNENTGKLKNDENFESIQIIDLDSLNLFKVDFIKIDVEGLGLKVLKGMRNTLQKCNPVVCIELFEHVEKIEQIKFMNQIGYNLVDNHGKEFIFKKG